MTSFDDRERSYETRFAREQEFEFKVQARAAKLVGQWAAETMGLSGQEAEAYAREVVKADVAELGSEDVVRKLHADFQARGVDCSEHRIRLRMDEDLIRAREQLAKEIGGQASA
jgi:hypothetical protein